MSNCHHGTLGRKDQPRGQGVWKGPRVASCRTGKVWEQNALTTSARRDAWDLAEEAGDFTCLIFLSKTQRDAITSTFTNENPLPWLLALVHLFLNYTLATDSSLPRLPKSLLHFSTRYSRQQITCRGNWEGVTWPNENVLLF